MRACILLPSPSSNTTFEIIDGVLSYLQSQRKCYTMQDRFTIQNKYCQCWLFTFLYVAIWLFFQLSISNLMSQQHCLCQISHYTLRWRRWGWSCKQHKQHVWNHVTLWKRDHGVLTFVGITLEILKETSGKFPALLQLKNFISSQTR